MASDKKEKKEKKDKKEKKVKETKLSSEDGKVKKDKKDKKKDKKEKAKLAAALDAHLQSDVAGQVEESQTKRKKKAAALPEANSTPVMDVPAVLVPFAVPLAGERDQKKVIKMVRRSAKANVLKRGVKEVVKSLRKSALATPTSRSFDGVVVIAGDISPPDVISHLPVLCEDHGVPYIFIQRRAELGSAARTKRPTSVVMVMEKAESKTKGADGKMVKTKEDVREEDGEGEGDYAEGYTELVGIVQREAREQAHWIKG